MTTSIHNIVTFRSLLFKSRVTNLNCIKNCRNIKDALIFCKIKEFDSRTTSRLISQFINTQNKNIYASGGGKNNNHFIFPNIDINDNSYMFVTFHLTDNNYTNGGDVNIFNVDKNMLNNYIIKRDNNTYMLKLKYDTIEWKLFSMYNMNKNDF